MYEGIQCFIPNTTQIPCYSLLPTQLIEIWKVMSWLRQWCSARQRTRIERKEGAHNMTGLSLYRGTDRVALSECSQNACLLGFEYETFRGPILSATVFRW